MQTKLYVGNLAMDVPASSLQELFEPCGFVMDVRLLSSIEAGNRRAAFVTTATDESAGVALSASKGTALHGVAITVEVAHEEGAQ